VDMMLEHVQGLNIDGVQCESYAQLAHMTWFRVGGATRLLVKVDHSDALAELLNFLPAHWDVYILGNGSNLLVRDGGFNGVVIKLGRGFRECVVESEFEIRAGAGCLDAQVAREAASSGIAGLEFLSTIPGTIGGASVMNAGAYGSDFYSMVRDIVTYDASRQRHCWSAHDIDHGYRFASIPYGHIVTEAVLCGHPDRIKDIQARIDDMLAARRATQPTREKTGGSTFKNPPGLKAWELIDRAGCRGLSYNGVRVSQKHCNFLINEGATRADDIEDLGTMVRERVREECGVELEWEIRRIGDRGNI